MSQTKSSSPNIQSIPKSKGKPVIESIVRDPENDAKEIILPKDPSPFDALIGKAFKIKLRFPE